MKQQVITAGALLASILLVSAVNAAGQTHNPSPSPTPAASPIEVVYTGRLMGYFRAPSLQMFGDDRCRNAPERKPSEAAEKFLDKRKNQRGPILVAAGDNFAPEMEARVFADPARSTRRYSARNKELFYFDVTAKSPEWVPYDAERPKLEELLSEGKGVIPVDNVACFFRIAEFSAIVPGKHDFYFGPERLRELARFLAKKAEGDGQPVQMLGANLVITTVPVGGTASKAVEQPEVGPWPDTYAVLDLKEGKSVYPWFSQVRIKLNNDGAPKGKDIRLCRSAGAPNQMPTEFEKCTGLIAEETEEGGAKILKLKLPRLELPDGRKPKGEHSMNLLPGANYGLCIEENSKKSCLRFSTYVPFFNFPHTAPMENTDGYTDPDPFVVIDDRVAIFGIVDPDLGKDIGILNFGWRNLNSGLTTRVSAEDPAEALRQQLDYFKEIKRDFKGLKILLAQTNPQRARALSARFPEFQLVVSNADKEQSTTEVETSTTWDTTTKNTRAFLAVPAPYFDASANQGLVYFATVRASLVGAKKWELKSPQFEESALDVINYQPIKTHAFWERIRKLPGCLPDNKESSLDNVNRLKWLVLCAMRDHLNADVALIQRRDLFDRLPEPGGVVRMHGNVDESIQAILDHLIWKGDLLTLLYVPGSALKTALQQSDNYDSQERSKLLLSVDKGRQLEVLGVRSNDGQYFINDLPLDEKRIYSVATTDYIGAGDTGYPDLIKDALNARTHPAAFSGKLVPISSLACQRLFDNAEEAGTYCLGPIDSSKYLDQTAAPRTPPYKQPGFATKVAKFFRSGWPAGSTEGKTEEEQIEQRVQRRALWRFSLQNLSFGFKGLGKNLSDAEVKEKFDGVPISGVTATENETYDVALNARLSRSWHKREFFVSTGLEFQRQSTGDSPSAFQISQARNRLFGETGFVFWRTPGRSLPNIGLNLSVYAETQLTHPFTDFELATGDKMRIGQDRSLFLLPRFGVRWQGLANSAEVGFQAGREINALSGYRFTTATGEVECLAKDSPSFSKCIKDNSDPAMNGMITKDSGHAVLLDDRPRAGIYWKLIVSRPFTPRVKYELEETGDFFFVNFSQDTSVDTRFRSISKHRLSFVVWPSVSIGPALDLLLYQNKIHRDFLFQRQFGFETRISFDVFNRREKGAQFKHKP